MRQASQFKYAVSLMVPSPFRRLVEEVQDAKALHNLSFLRDSYLPWTGSAIRPRTLEIVINEILIHEKKTIVECGAGMSTVILGKLMSNIGGELICLEHDEKWANFIRKQIPADYPVEIVVAPLVSENGQTWYERSLFREALGSRKIELLLVDGPIAENGKFARYPAVGELLDSFAKEYCVVLDDIHRRDELQTLRKWVKEFGLTEYLYFGNGGLAILRPSGSVSTFNVI